MQEFIENRADSEGLVSHRVMQAALASEMTYALYVGLDVHKDTIAVAVAWPGRGEAQYRGEIANTPKALRKLVDELNADTGGELVAWCYEAGPCGYGLYRQLLGLGQHCEVVAAPRRERIKTDRRDAKKLARKLRAGELTVVWVPDVEQEAMRDISRCRSDFTVQRVKARQQLNAFVLRHGHCWPRGRSRWTQKHMQWLVTLEFEHPWQREVLCEYLNALESATERLEALQRRLLEEILPQWSLAPVIDSLIALRGIDKVSALTLMAELGDITRFDSPRELMGYLGLVPSVHDSGQARGRRGAITRAGNEHARRMLVEAGWCYRFEARQTAHMKRKAVNASPKAKAIALRAQTRLCGRYRTLVGAGKNTKVTCVAIARELVGFVWDIVRHEMPALGAA